MVKRKYMVLRLAGSDRIESKISALRVLKGDHFSEEMRLRHEQLRLLHRNVSG